MFSKLTVKPLLWATSILALLLAASATLNVRQWKQIGAARAECEVTKLEDTNTRNDVVRNLEAESLRSKVEALESEIRSLQAINHAVQLRHAESAILLNEYRKQLNEARKADPSLDEPIDTSRLRALEDAHRVRPRPSGGGEISRDP